MKRIISISILCLTIGLTAAACGGSDASSGSGAAAGEGQSQAQGQGGGGRSPGGSGEVTDVSGTTAQVKGQDSQVAVTWTDATTFTQQVSATAADIAVGSCVMVTSADADSTSTDAVDAASVRITEAVDGTCSVMGGMGGGRGGEAPSGERPTDLPTDMPTDLPSGAPGGGQGGGQGGGPGGRGGFAVGEVTAVTDTGFTVSSQLPAAGGAEATATTVTVTTSADTTYSATAAAKASDVTVGACVTSRGDADDTGAITATSIAVTQPVDGTCSLGFGGGRPAAAS